MKIRSAGRDDIPVLREIIKHAYRTVAERFTLTPENCPKHPSNCTELWLEGDFDRGVRYYILETEGTPAACAAIEKADETTCYLERLAVIPDFRGRGMGRALVRHIISLAAAAELQKISIGIIAEQHDLRSWYCSLGFRQTGTRDFEHLPFQVMFMEQTLGSQASGREM